MPYCIYLRKSRADEEAELRGEEDTLARYERALLDLARRQKLNITAIYPRGGLRRDNLCQACHAATAL